MKSNKLIIANMKMNMSLNDVLDYLEEFNEYNNVILCPSSIYLPYFIDCDYKVGIQNISEYDKGSYTGEISAKQAKSLGIKYAIIGHSERRMYYHENDEIVTKKLKKALSNNIKPILCVGESLVERKTHVAKDKVKIQLIESIRNIDPKYYKDIFIAYEPIWAIGTNRIPKIDDLKSMIEFIKETINTEFGFKPHILYGGGVNDKNIEQLNNLSDLDGFLVGSASLDPNKFIRLIEAVK